MSMILYDADSDLHAAQKKSRTSDYSSGS